MLLASFYLFLFAYLSEHASRLSSELIRVYLEITRPPRKTKTLFFLFFPRFFFHADTWGRLIVQAVAKIIAKIICTCPALCASWILASSFPHPYTLWILMARFVFTTRGWIFHRCEGRKGDDHSPLATNACNSKMTNDDVTIIALDVASGVCMSNCCLLLMENQPSSLTM